MTNVQQHQQHFSFVVWSVQKQSSCPALLIGFASDSDLCAFAQEGKAAYSCRIFSLFWSDKQFVKELLTIARWDFLLDYLQLLTKNIKVNERPLKYDVSKMWVQVLPGDSRTALKLPGPNQYCQTALLWNQLLTWVRKAGTTPSFKGNLKTFW